MPPSVISFAESALTDLETIKEWYAEQGAPQMGDKLVAEVFERIAVLADHPDMGRVVPEFEQPFLRELIHPPFRIVYRRDRDRVRIVRVWRSERLLSLFSDDDV
jgi:plasmid stabilization system protein ParE